MKNIISLLVVSLLLASCANKFSLQKRKYTKGFYFASSSPKRSDAKVIKTPTEDLTKNEDETVSTVIVEPSRVSVNSEAGESTTNNDQVAADKHVVTQNNVLNEVTKPTPTLERNTISQGSKKADKRIAGVLGTVLGAAAYILAGLCGIGFIVLLIAFLATGESFALAGALLYLLFAVLFAVAAQALGS